MGLLKDKFEEICKKHNLEMDYEEYMGYVFYSADGYYSMYKVTYGMHSIQIVRTEPKAVRDCILEFSIFVNELEDK